MPTTPTSNRTRATSDQVRFRSELTGDHVLDLYMEACEKGGRTLFDLLDDLFDENATFYRGSGFYDWLGDYAHPVTYQSGDTFRDPADQSLYVTLQQFTSTGDLSADLAAGHIALVMDGTALTDATNAAQSSATDAASSASSASDSASAASGSASASASSASNAATSASNAATSEGNAAQSAQEAEDIVAAIDKDTIARVNGDYLHLRARSTTKDDVGLSNVPNTDATNASNINSGTLNTSRLPTNVSARDWVQARLAAAPGSMRDALDLGTAAIADVTQSSTDTTAGRLLTPGAGGVCGNAITLTSGDNLNDLLVSGLYFNPSAANAAGNNYPIDYAGSVLNIRRTANNHTQRFSAFAPNSLPEDIRIFERSRGLGAWSPWVEIFHQGRILGTVSQSGGIPTGALFERGSNSNGEYVRFADGTQICSRTFSLPAPDSEFLSPSFPASFSAAPAVVLHAYIPDQSSDDRYANVAYAAVSSSEISGIRVRRVTPNSDAAIVTYHAIGRWF